MRDHLDRFGDALPVVVTFGDDPRRVAAHRRHLGVEFPVLLDADLALYRALGVGRGSRRAVWSPGTIAAYARLLRAGRRLQRPTPGRPMQDTRQLGADAIVDRVGRLAQVWRPPSPDARPSIDELAAALDDLAEPVSGSDGGADDVTDDSP